MLLPCKHIYIHACACGYVYNPPTPAVSLYLYINLLRSNLLYNEIKSNQINLIFSDQCHLNAADDDDDDDDDDADDDDDDDDDDEDDDEDDADDAAAADDDDDDGPYSPPQGQHPWGRRQGAAALNIYIYT